MRQTIEIDEQGLHISIDGRRDCPPVIRTEFVDMAAAIDLSKATNDRVAICDTMSTQVEAVATDAVHQPGAEMMVRDAAYLVEGSQEASDAAAVAVADGV